MQFQDGQSQSAPSPQQTLLQQAITQMLAQQQQEQAEPQEMPQHKDPSIGLAPYLALMAGQGLDLGTTAYALGSGKAHEANPVLSAGLKAVVPAKVGMTALMALLAHHLDNTGHDKAGKAVGYLGGIGGAIPGLMNLNTLMKK